MSLIICNGYNLKKVFLLYKIGHLWIIILIAYSLSWPLCGHENSENGQQFVMDWEDMNQVSVLKHTDKTKHGYIIAATQQALAPENTKTEHRIYQT